MKNYAFGSVQFTRGCPFTCEFCDIIVIFGRKPRLKTAAQITAELDALVAQNMSLVFIVDDNLIGNKKGDQGTAACRHRLAEGARLSDHVHHRSLDGSRR